MLPRSARLSRTDFTKYFKAGTRIHSPYATIICAPSTESRAAVVVSKKVAQHAVDRNRLRRLVYSLLQTEWIGAPGVCIVLLKPTAATVARATLQSELVAAIGRGRKSL